MKVLHQFLHARVRVGVDVDVGGVEGFEICQGGVHKGVVRLSHGFAPGGKRFFKRLPHQVAHAVAHHGAVLLQAVQRKAADRKRMVYRGGKVFQRVQQGAVKVEQDQFVWRIHG